MTNETFFGCFVAIGAAAPRGSGLTTVDRKRIFVMLS
jgi:hypothetical protein